MTEFFKIIIGGYSAAQLFGFIWFFAIGWLITTLDDVTGRDVESSRTPRRWSWHFWFLDNWRRYIVTVLSTYVMFRFYNELTGHPLTEFECLMLGMVCDNIGRFAKRYVYIAKANRQQLMSEYKFE